MVGVVVHKDDLLEQVVGRPIQHGMHGAQQHGPGLVVEAHDDGSGGELGEVAVRGLAPAGRTTPIKSTRHCSKVPSGQTVQLSMLFGVSM